MQTVLERIQQEEKGLKVKNMFYNVDWYPCLNQKKGCVNHVIVKGEYCPHCFEVEVRGDIC